MAIFKVPRITSEQRLAIILEVAEIVFDTTLNRYFGGDGVLQGGFPIGYGLASSSDRITERIQLTQSDIQNKQVTLANTPSVAEFVIISPMGGIQQVYGLDYIVAGKTVLWESLGLEQTLEAGEVLVIQYAIDANAETVETFVLTQADLLAKQVTLSKTPKNPQALSLVPHGGIPQVYGLDYYVAENILRWDGMGLDNFLELNDAFVVHY